ncbi:PEP-CTERM sorting domain-containing protein [Leptothoe sp. ISB3NOV94-8A]|uniref:PEP-CTERM sorting domain-containing protein n=2 Tax=Adonisia turfae TaxID=2950184 RepID=A0A6M0RYU8_9CYAN|nr:PEP-CTERM sorting domain-containing protein [Adonisia turfae]MDV3348246.1 PEP-CTERM sorting domain-containing protein [Leptothoe sp. LEGE 181152]NEZ60861.1 PEP-CTERM sorting domain-containing protein [Adonisia turfae CCMR0081]
MLNQSKGYLVAAFSSLGLLAAMTQPASANTFRGIEFPLGESSFADEVVDYNKVYANGLTKEDAYGKNWKASAQAFDNPTSVLGVANSSWKGNKMPIAQRDDFSLGKGGSITVKFTDNVLVGSDDDKDDLWIFEAGGLVEGMFVEVSKDGNTWLSLGEIGGTQHAGIDLDAFGFTSNDAFSYVKVTDNGKNRYNQGWAGVDVDAIGAISSKDVPEPASLLGLLTVGSFIMTSVLKRR